MGDPRCIGCQSPYCASVRFGGPCLNASPATTIDSQWLLERALASRDTFVFRAPIYTRDDLVRAVLAQQWAVAVTLITDDDRLKGEYWRGWDDGWGNATDAVGALPCADDVVAEMLGEASR